MDIGEHHQYPFVHNFFFYSPLFMPKLFNTLAISKEAQDEWLVTLSTGNDIGVCP